MTNVEIDLSRVSPRSHSKAYGGKVLLEPHSQGLKKNKKRVFAQILDKQPKKKLLHAVNYCASDVSE